MSDEVLYVTSAGKKYDKDKPRPSLLPVEGLEAVLQVLEHGAKKYGFRNWQLVENGKERYSEALLRHAMSFSKGLDKGTPYAVDDETGYTELAHIATNALFLLYLKEHE